MDNQNIYTVLITIVSTLGGVNAWRYFEKRASNKEDDDRFIRNDCKTRILKLETSLVEAEKQKDELRALVLNLSTEVASLNEQVKYLMKGKGL
jgi:hypothetical protein